MGKILQLLLSYKPVTIRGRAIIFNSAATFGLRVVAAICSFVQVPIALQYLGQTEFGLWIMLTSAVGIMAFADFGVGYGVQNFIAEAVGRGDDSRVESILAQGILVLGFIGAAVFLVGFPLIQVFPWNEYLTVDVKLVTGVRLGAIVLLFVFAVNLPFIAFQRAAAGMQVGWISSVCTMIANVLALGIVWISAKLKLSFAYFVFFAAMPVLLGNATLCIILILKYRWRLYAKLRWDPLDAASLLKAGLPFTIPQLSSLALSMGPSLIIAAILNPAAVAIYNIAQRLLSLFGSLHGMLILTLWPSFTEARSRGDVAWVRRAYARTLWGTVIVIAVPMSAFPLWAPFVVKYWIGSGFNLDFGFMLAVGLLAAVSACSMPPAMLLNSMGRVLGQATYGSVVTVLSLVLMPVALRKWGLIAAPATVLMLFSFISFPLVIYEAEKALKKL